MRTSCSYLRIVRGGRLLWEGGVCTYVQRGVLGAAQPLAEDESKGTRAKALRPAETVRGCCCGDKSLDCFNSPTETGLDIRLPAPHSSGWRGDHIADQSESRKERESPGFPSPPPAGFERPDEKIASVGVGGGDGNEPPGAVPTISSWIVCIRLAQFFIPEGGSFTAVMVWNSAFDCCRLSPQQHQYQQPPGSKPQADKMLGSGMLMVFWIAAVFVLCCHPIVSAAAHPAVRFWTIGQSSQRATCRACG
jgi:hypothetical protein